MNIKIEEVNWYLSEGIKEGTVIFSINGNKYRAFSSNFDYEVGSIVDVEFNQIEKDFSWEEIFQGNPEKKMCLIPRGEWSYDAYGKIISINPVKVNFGDIVLELGEWTHDKSVIGEYIYWKISRLDIIPG